MLPLHKDLEAGGKSPACESFISAAGVEHTDSVWQRINVRILPVVAMFYLLSFIDQTSLGNARVVGMQKEISMTNYQFCLAITVTFIPYTLIQLPFTILLKRLGPQYVLPTIAMAWGFATMSQAMVTSYYGLLWCRGFLGLLTGGVSPGLVMYLSFFYPRQQLSLKIAAFFCMASVASAFSGLLAFAIVHLNGLWGFTGWAWIFLLEGGFTMVFGLFSFILLPAGPEHCKFLTDAERIYVLSELQELGTSGEKDAFSWREVWYAFTSPHVLMVAATFFFTGAIIDGLSYFTPSIVYSLGYKATEAQLYCVPPFLLSAFICLACAFVADSYNFRAPVALFCGVLCIMGFELYLASGSFMAKYYSLFLSIPGAYCITPALSAWNANNSAPMTRRASATALGFFASNGGGITVAWLYGTLSPPPLYKKANTVLLWFSVAGVVTSLTNAWYLHAQNEGKKKLRQRLGDKRKEDSRLGDKSAYFDYCL